MGGLPAAVRSGFQSASEYPEDRGDGDNVDDHAPLPWGYFFGRPPSSTSRPRLCLSASNFAKPAAEGDEALTTLENATGRVLDEDRQPATHRFIVFFFF